MEAERAPVRPAHAEPFLTRLIKDSFGFARSRTSEPEDAKDDVQNGVVLLLDQLDTNQDLWNDPKKALLLLIGIIRNTGRNRVRHETVVETNAPEVGREMDDARSRVGEPEFDMDQRRLRALLYTAIDALRPDEQELLQMRYADGMKVADIAAEVGEKPERVSTDLRRALNKLEKVPGLRAFHDQWKGDQ